MNDFYRRRVVLLIWQVRDKFDHLERQDFHDPAKIRELNYLVKRTKVQLMHLSFKVR